MSYKTYAKRPSKTSRARYNKQLLNIRPNVVNRQTPRRNIKKKSRKKSFFAPNTRMSRKNNQLSHNTPYNRTKTRTRTRTSRALKNPNLLINTTNTSKYQQPRNTIKKRTKSRILPFQQRILNKKRAEMTHTPEPQQPPFEYQQSDGVVNTELQDIFSQQQQYESTVVGLFQNNSELYNTILIMIDNLMGLLRQLETKRFIMNNFINNILDTCYSHAYILYKRESTKLSKTMKNKVNNLGNIMNNSASASMVNKLSKYNRPEPYVRNNRNVDMLSRKLSELNYYYSNLCSSENIDCSQQEAGTIQLINPYNIRIQTFYPHIKSKSMLRQFMVEDMNSVYLHLQQNNVLLNNINSYLIIVTNYLTQTITELHKQDQAMTSETLAKRAIKSSGRKPSRTPKASPKPSRLSVSASAKPLVTIEQALEKYKSLMQTPDADYVMGELNQEELELLCQKANIPKSECKKSNKALFFKLIKNL